MDIHPGKEVERCSAPYGPTLVMSFPTLVEYVPEFCIKKHSFVFLCSFLSLMNVSVNNTLFSVACSGAFYKWNQTDSCFQVCYKHPCACLVVHMSKRLLVARSQPLRYMYPVEELLCHITILPPHGCRMAAATSSTQL